MEEKTERLQKVLARAGIASRRHAEAYILAGRVRVNGTVVATLGVRVDPQRDKVEVDGRRILAEPWVYYIFHKPRGVVTTLQDPEGRPTLAEYTRDIPVRVFPIGRLDFHTSGAILLTNDGGLAQALLHPRHSVAKTYVCKVKGVPTDLQLDPWRTGMLLPPTESDPNEPRVNTLPADIDVLRYAPPGEAAVRDMGSTWIKVTLYEGRTRQIHRMAEATGLFVMRLARLSFAGLTTEGLRPGMKRPLTDKELTALLVKYLRPLEQAAGGGAMHTEAPAKPGKPQRGAARGAKPSSTGWTSPAPRDVPVRTPKTSGAREKSTTTGAARAGSRKPSAARTTGRHRRSG